MNNPSSPHQSAPNPSFQNFLESLRRQPSPSPENLESPFENFQRRRHLEEQRKAEFFRARQKETNEVYSLKRKQEEQKIDEILKKLRHLAQSFKKLDKEVKKATQEQIVEPGQYHKSFLDHIANVIDILKRQVESSQTWLHLFNQRSKKKAFYWQQVSRSGSKFMLASERQIATSLG